AVDADRYGAGQVLRPAAEAAGVGAVRAEGQERLAAGGELLNPSELRFGGENVPLPVDGDEVGAAGPILQALDAVELTGLCAILSPLAEELPLRIEPLHPAIHLVGDVERAIRGKGDAARLVELSIAGPQAAPFAQELACSIEDADLVAHHGGDEHTAGVIDGDPAGHSRDRELSKVLALGREPLHAVVHGLGDVDLVRGVDGHADRGVELPFAF